jgi:exodeoxyribonuclease VII large subunit
MRGRHAAELTHTLVRALGSALAVRERRLHAADRQLDRLNVARRLADARTRLVAADAGSRAAVASRWHRAAAALSSCAARLETLSPLAVLGRGYAVCWDADRTRALRSATEAAPGDRVRVTLARGELTCEVRSLKP